MDPKVFASRYEKWHEIYNWETCLADRKEYGKFLVTFLTGNSRVLNLNGPYGTGKTEFIRRLYVELASLRYPVVYIDAWESDFSKNPLTVIASELLTQIDYIFEQKASSKALSAKKSAARKKFNSLKKSLGIVLKLADATAPLLLDPENAALVKTGSATVNATPNIDARIDSEKLIDNLKKEHIQAVEAVKNIKNRITDLSEFIEVIYELKIPIVILIDELDRCRPTYAVEFLEVIKHFFETKGCTFLVATNTEVLEQSVRSLYGSDFKADIYLRKFFERKVNLPKVTLGQYLSQKHNRLDNYSDSNIVLLPFINDLDANVHVFASMFESNSLELRDVDQILDRFYVSLDYASELSKRKSIALNTVVLMAGLIEQHENVPQFDSRTQIGVYSTSLKFEGIGDSGMHKEKLVNAMFDSVMFSEGTKRYGPGSTTRHSKRAPILNMEQSNYYDLRVYDDGRSHLWHGIVEKMLTYYRSGSCKYWLWEDYKKVISLSGHIIE